MKSLRNSGRWILLQCLAVMVIMLGLAVTAQAECAEHQWKYGESAGLWGSERHSRTCTVCGYVGFDEKHEFVYTGKKLPTPKAAGSTSDNIEAYGHYATKTCSKCGWSTTETRFTEAHTFKKNVCTKCG